MMIPATASMMERLRRVNESSVWGIPFGIHSSVRVRCLSYLKRPAFAYNYSERWSLSHPSVEGFWGEKFRPPILTAVQNSAILYGNQEARMETKLTVRVPQRLLNNAKRYAAAHNTTLTELISTYLERIPAETESLDRAPIVRRLTGLLSVHVSVDDYKKHLDEKYGSQ